MSTFYSSRQERRGPFRQRESLKQRPGGMECYNVLGDGKLSGVSWSTGGLKGMEREDAKTWRGVGI